jgi:hypothetical protein
MGRQWRDILFPFQLELKFPVILQICDKIADHSSALLKPLLKVLFIITLTIYKHIHQKTAVGRAVFRSGSSLSDFLSSFCYSLETHPECFRDSDTQGCLTLRFAKTVNERRAKSLKPTLPTAEYGIKYA